MIRSNIFKWTQEGGAKYTLKLLVGAYNATTADTVEVECPALSLLGELEVSGAYTEKIPIGLSENQTLDIKLDIKNLKDNGFSELWKWIKGNGRDLTSWQFDGYYTKEHLTENLEFIPNCWVLYKNTEIKFIGVQASSSRIELNLEDGKAEYTIKSTSIFKYVLERVKAQFFNQKWWYNCVSGAGGAEGMRWGNFNNGNIADRITNTYLELDTQRLGGVPYVGDGAVTPAPINYNNKVWALIDVYKRFVSSNNFDTTRAVYQYLRDNRFNARALSFRNLFKTINFAYQEVLKNITRNQILSKADTEKAEIANPLFIYTFTKQNYEKSINVGAAYIDDSDKDNLFVLDSIYFFDKYGSQNSYFDTIEYNNKIQSKFTNCWNFLNQFYDGFPCRIKYNYTTLSLDCSSIIDTDYTKTITADDIVQSSINAIALNNEYQYFEVIPSGAIESNKIKSIRKNYSSSTAEKKMISTAYIHNWIDEPADGVGCYNQITLFPPTRPLINVKIAYSLYGSNSVEKFPIGKIFYLDNVEVPVSEGNAIKQTLMSVGWKVYLKTYNDPFAVSLTIPDTNIYNAYLQSGDYTSTVNFIRSFQTTGLIGLNVNVFDNYLHNNNCYLIELELSADTIDTTNIGDQIKCDFVSIFGAGLDYDEGEIADLAVVAGADTNYSENTTKATFFVRGDKYINL